jgi:hypothetical protein
MKMYINGSKYHSDLDFTMRYNLESLSQQHLLLRNTSLKGALILLGCFKNRQHFCLYPKILLASIDDF